MLTASDNELLTRTGPGSVMGAYFREFWQPIALSRELPEPDCPPVRVRLLGENLLAFRDSTGRVGLIEPRCPHRGADLFFGRNEDSGIRCVYHGWKFDVNGACIEVPGVEDQGKLCARISIKAYPTAEFGDLVWAYLGTASEIPRVPQLEMGMLPSSHRFVTKKLQQCNWAQSIEGALDTGHFSFLHMPAPHVKSNANPDAPQDEKRLRWSREDPVPHFHIAEHDVGFVIGASRRADGEELYWRMTQFMLPAHSSTPATLPGENYYGYTWAPIGDESCWIYTYVWNPLRPLTDEERGLLSSGHGVVAKVDADYVPLANRENNYLLDRALQKHSTFTGVRGLAEQDAMIHDSLGYVADRTREHLIPTDAAVVRFRRLILREARALAGGARPETPFRHDKYRLRSGSWVAPASTPFEDVMMQRFGDRLGQVRA